MKKILAASWDHRHLNEDKLCRALLQYRNTPSRKDGHSPAQKLFGHPHTAAPSHQSGRRAPKKQNNKPPRHWNNQKHSTTYMPAHYLTYALALRWLYKVNRQNYGMYTGQLSPSDLIAGTTSRLTVDVFWCVIDASYDAAYRHHFNPLFQYVIQAHPINIPPFFTPTSISRIYHPYTPLPATPQATLKACGRS